MFIVIEGLDGCGKSTVSTALAKMLNAQLLTSPDKELKEVRKVTDMVFDNNVKARQMFYMASILKASEDAKELNLQGKPVVLDRYWLSTQVYHAWMSNGKQFKCREVELVLHQPTLTVYLDVPAEVRANRIKARNVCTDEDMNTLQHNANEKLRSLYFSMNKSLPVGNWLCVDACQSVDIILEKIMTELEILMSNKMYIKDDL